MSGTEPLPLPSGIRSRILPGINGLSMHVLEAGFDAADRPLVLLLHGFPELAFSWRKVMLPLAATGFHVVAPDQRGYGRTTGWDDDYDGDLASFRMLNLVRDALGLVWALGYRSVAAVVGHDFGASVAAWSALIRPDIFTAVALMSAPFAGPPAPKPSSEKGRNGIHDDLAALARPRKHYQWYYSTRAAAEDMRRPPQGIAAFLRGYFHHKSADWAANRPFPLQGWRATELAKLPTYYVMDRDRTMPETVSVEMPSPAEVAACKWLPDDELAVYAAEYGRTGFQGGLQWYRCRTSGLFETELEVFSGRGIDVPSCFIAGASDWGIHQTPGAIDRMRDAVLTRMRFCELVPSAGHWVQQERPDDVVRLLERFLQTR